MSSQLNATLAAQGVKGVACIWRANEEFVDKYNMALELPTDLVTFTSMSFLLILGLQGGCPPSVR